MIGRKLDTLLALIGLGTIAYVFFKVPIGGRTFYEHSRRIAATEPARELERDVRRTSEAVGSKVASEVRAITDGRGDAGL